MFEDMLSAQKPQEYAAMYIDMDAFFASVAQQEHPRLRGKPVGVAPCLGSNCSIVAASYEARAYGVGVGTRIRRAQELCPMIEVVRDDPVVYRRYHDQILAVLDATICHIGVRGIDEAYMLVPSYAQSHHNVYALAKDIKQSIKNQVGEHISCSIGIAPNIWLAKMAAQSNKPNGVTILTLEGLTEFYRGLPLVSCTGIGRRMAKRLYDVGVSGTADLAARPLPFMRGQLGVLGEKWYLRLRGFEVDEAKQSRKRKSISHQVTVLGDRKLTKAQREKYVIALATRLSARLRRYGLKARGIGLYISYSDARGVHREFPHTRCLQGEAEIVSLSLELLESTAAEGREVRLLALWLSGLTAVEQQSLQLEDAESLQDAALSRAIDKLNAKFGPHTVQRAVIASKDYVPDRIGFGNS
jgi:DNA polymerase-4